MHPRYRQSNQGSVFIVVLTVSLALVSMALLFGHSMLMAWRGSDNQFAGRQADQAIEGAARYAQYLMGNVSNPGDLPDPTTYQSEAVPVGDAKFWFIGLLSATSVVTKPAFGLVDEASKLNLNTASASMLQLLPGMTPDLATAIVNWRNTSSDQSSAFADSMISSAPVKNAHFETVQELALLTGTDTTVLYGEDTNLNHALDPNEDDSDKSAPPDNADGKLDSGLLEYVTVFSREPNRQPNGTKRINVQQGSSRELTTLLSGTLGNAASTRITTAITASLRQRPGRIRSVLEFKIRSGMTDTEFASVSSCLTCSNANYLNGLVNVNTASQAVLTCIPGIGAKAADLISARLNQSTPSTNLAWIIPILGEAGAIAAGPYLTTRTYQVSADVAAVGRHGRGYRRSLFVIDSSTGTPQIVYRRNLAALGWALGKEIREMLTNDQH